MADIISYKFFKEWAEVINKIFGTDIPEIAIAIFSLIVLALSLLFIIIKPIYKYIINPFYSNRKWRKNELNKILIGYDNYTDKEQRKLYIETWLQESPPNEHDEPSQAQSRDLRTRTNAIDHFIKNVLQLNNNFSPYYCILGGSGMGKSTFVVNLIWRYINNYNEKDLPYPIQLINCGETIELIKSIDEIDNKRNTVLILDALDENYEAIVEYKVFLEKLLKSIITFRIAIITCRTQFFEKNEDELDVVSEKIHEPLTKRAKHFLKYYISPFETQEIDSYLDKKYRSKPEIKKKAKSIVDRCNLLMARPLLLSYIDDLLNSDIDNNDYSIARIYEIIIDKWLEREADFAKTSPSEREEYKKKLLDFSSEMALCLAKPSSNQSEVKDIIEKYSTEKFIEPQYLKGRSLLNRNTKDDFKFAHKSFMEYLVAKQMFEKKNVELESIDCLSNDMIHIFLSALLSADIINDKKNYIMILLSRNFFYSFDLKYFYSLFQPSFLPLSTEIQSNNIHNKSNWIDIYIQCDVSENIKKYFYILPHIFKESKRFHTTNIHIVIDCRFNYDGIIDTICDIPQNSDYYYFTFTFQNCKLQSKSFMFSLRKLTDNLSHIRNIVFVPCPIKYPFRREYDFWNFIISLVVRFYDLPKTPILFSYIETPIFYIDKSKISQLLIGTEIIEGRRKYCFLPLGNEHRNHIGYIAS